MPKQILLDAGAQINPILRTSKNVFMTPLDCAMQRGFRSTAKFLQLHGGVPANRLRHGPVPMSTSTLSLQIRDDVTFVGGSSSESESVDIEEKQKRKSYRKKIGIKKKESAEVKTHLESKKDKIDSKDLNKDFLELKNDSLRDRKEINGINKRRGGEKDTGFLKNGKLRDVNANFSTAGRIDIIEKSEDVRWNESDSDRLEKVKDGRLKEKKLGEADNLTQDAEEANSRGKLDRRPKSAKYSKIQNNEKKKPSKADTPDPRRKDFLDDVNNSNRKLLVEIKREDSIGQRTKSTQYEIEIENSLNSTSEMIRSKVQTIEKVTTGGLQSDIISNTSCEEIMGKNFLVEAAVHSPPKQAMVENQKLILETNEGLGLIEEVNEKSGKVKSDFKENNVSDEKINVQNVEEKEIEEKEEVKDKKETNEREGKNENESEINLKKEMEGEKEIIKDEGEKDKEKSLRESKENLMEMEMENKEKYDEEKETTEDQEKKIEYKEQIDKVDAEIEKSKKILESEENNEVRKDEHLKDDSSKPKQQSLEDKDTPKKLDTSSDSKSEPQTVIEKISSNMEHLGQGEVFQDEGVKETPRDEHKSDASTEESGVQHDIVDSVTSTISETENNSEIPTEKLVTEYRKEKKIDGYGEKETEQKKQRKQKKERKGEEEDEEDNKLKSRKTWSLPDGKEGKLPKRVLTKQADSIVLARKRKERSAQIESTESDEESLSRSIRTHKSFTVIDADEDERKTKEKGKKNSTKKSRSRSDESKRECMKRSKIPTPTFKKSKALSKSDKCLDDDYRRYKSEVESKVPSLPNLGDVRTDQKFRNGRIISDENYYKNDHQFKGSHQLRSDRHQFRSASNISMPLTAYSDNEKGSGSDLDSTAEANIGRKKRFKKRPRTRGKSAGSDYDSNVIDSGFEPSPRSIKVPKWRNVSERGVNMTSVTQSIQTNIRRFSTVIFF